MKFYLLVREDKYKNTKSNRTNNCQRENTGIRHSTGSEGTNAHIYIAAFHSSITLLILILMSGQVHNDNKNNEQKAL